MPQLEQTRYVNPVQQHMQQQATEVLNAAATLLLMQKAAANDEGDKFSSKQVTWVFSATASD